MYKTTVSGMLAVWCGLAVCPPAQAQTAPPTAGPAADQAQATPPGWRIDLGAGVLAAPAYPGAKSTRAIGIPSIDITDGDRINATYQDGLTYTAIRLDNFSAGPALRFRFGRMPSDDRSVLRGLGKIGPSVQAGGFAAYNIGPVTLRAFAGQDIARGTGGAVAELSASYTQAIFGTAAGPWLLSAGPRLVAADRAENSSYFGIDDVQSRRSGRALYRAAGGLQSGGAELALIVPVTAKLTVTAIAGYDRLLPVAARSPLIRNGVGNPNQLTGGLFVSWRFF